MSKVVLQIVSIEKLTPIWIVSRHLAPEYFMHGIVDENRYLCFWSSAAGYCHWKETYWLLQAEPSSVGGHYLNEKTRMSETETIVTKEQFTYMTCSCCLGKATSGGWSNDWTCRPEPRWWLWQGSAEEDGRRRVALHYATRDVAALDGRGTMHQLTSWSDWHIVTSCEMLTDDQTSSSRCCIFCLLQSALRSLRNGTFWRTRSTTWMIAPYFLNLVPCFLHLVLRNRLLFYLVLVWLLCHGVAMCYLLCFFPEFRSLIWSLRCLGCNHVI